MGFDLFEYHQARWVESKLDLIPASLRDAALWNHNQKIIKDGLREANIWLRESVDSIKAPRLIASLDINADHNDINDLAASYARQYIDFYATFGEERTIKNAEDRLEKPITGLTNSSRLLRVTDQKFWKRQVRKSLRIHRELCHIKLNPTSLNYCSVDANHEYKKMVRGHEEWAKAHVFTSNDGREFPAPTPAETSKNRYAQLTALTQGLADEAQENGMEAQIITLTLDSHYHPTTTTKTGIRVINKKFDDQLTPKDGHIFFNEQWAKLRKVLNKKEIEVLWVLGVQPHQDETIHWHLVVWTNPKQTKTFNDLVIKFFKTNLNPNQIDFQKVNSSNGACAYSMRMLQYITRQLDESEAQAEAVNASAWASTFGIRRYRTSHSFATLWRLSRSNDIKVNDEMRYSAKAGAFLDFKKSAIKCEARIIYKEKINSYGEAYKTPFGISFIHDEEEFHSIKTATWTIQKFSADGDSYFKTPSKSKPEIQNQKTLAAGKSSFVEVYKPRYSPPAAGAAPSPLHTGTIKKPVIPEKKAKPDSFNSVPRWARGAAAHPHSVGAPATFSPSLN